MPVRIELAKVCINPSWGYEPLPNETFRLLQVGESHIVERVQQIGRSRKTQRLPVPMVEVQSQLEALRSAHVPAFPCSPLSCDGSYVEVVIYGEGSTLSMGWWVTAPMGAEVLADFADWILGKFSVEA